MLYKKYHRNFVKQFKKGTRFEINKMVCEVVDEPFIDDWPSKIRLGAKTIKGDSKIQPAVVYTFGKLSIVIKNVIQKIS